MSKRAYRLYLALSIVAFLNGCASPPILFDHNSGTQVQRIVIVGPSEPASYSAISGNAVLAMGAAAGVGGIVGNSVAASMLEEAERKGDFNAEMQIVIPNLGGEFRSALAAALAKDGYSVAEKVLPHKFDQWPSYEAISNDNDAVFDASILALYESDAFSSNYTPTLVIEAQLIDKRTGKVLYRTGYNYGGHSKTNLSDPRYSFSSYQELINNPQRAAEYFRSGIPILAAAFARDLQK